MTDGTSQGLFIVVAIVIFGIFTLMAYILFEDTLSPALANMFTDATDVVNPYHQQGNLMNNGDFSEELQMSLGDNSFHRYWYARLNTEIKIDTVNKIDNKNTLHIKFDENLGDVVHRFPNVRLSYGKEVTISFLAKSSTDTVLQFRLGGQGRDDSNTMKVVTETVTSEVKRYTITLKENKKDFVYKHPNGRENNFAMVFNSSSPSEIWMTDLSVTYSN